MVKYYKDELSHVFYALADGNRRHILELVAKKPRNASDLARRFDMSFPAVSKHVRILEDAGFVRRKIVGREHRIAIQKRSLDKAHGWIEAHRKFWTESLDRLEEYLKQSENPT
ncbi:MAG: metalloregulator ArsR/SmtB family transcription factor [Candidatus Omnitrophota bacterium]|nr:metalloregulator ArsR/SmtB family transcription factor [Candidatus Omnitrophota bacterium]MDZ4241974.1 metalloregulator ArsR/SmtB family transcription factor [Candidatus Omnitrophota bacterium]